MRHLPRREDGISWSQPVSLVADLDDVITLDDVELLLLCLVKVLRWPTLDGIGDLDNEKAAVRI